MFLSGLFFALFIGFFFNKILNMISGAATVKRKKDVSTRCYLFYFYRVEMNYCYTEDVDRVILDLLIK